MLRKILVTTSLMVLMGSPALADSHQADIVDTAIAADDFNTLIAAVQAAGLEETLRGEGPFTVFAPTDDAFAALPEGTVEALLEDIPTLTSILTYHVVPDAVASSSLSDGMVVETVHGQTVTFTVRGTVQINGATVVTPDVTATNGVIHVIDAVLMPE